MYKVGDRVRAKKGSSPFEYLEKLNLQTTIFTIENYSAWQQNVDGNSDKGLFINFRDPNSRIQANGWNSYQIHALSGWEKVKMIKRKTVETRLP